MGVAVHLASLRKTPNKKSAPQKEAPLVLYYIRRKNGSQAKSRCIWDNKGSQTKLNKKLTRPPGLSAEPPAVMGIRGNPAFEKMLSFLVPSD